MTPRQKERVYELLNEGLTTPQIVTRLRGAVTKEQVAACRAHWTMSQKTKVFQVEGTFVIEATSRDEAIAVASTRRIAGTKVLASEVSASRLPASEAEHFLS